MQNSLENPTVVEPTVQGKSLDELVPLIKQAHAASQKCDLLSKEQGQKAIQAAIEAGRFLTQAKELVAQGQWTDWLKNNFPFTPRTAENYMRLSDPKHVSVLIGCPTLRQAYIRAGICKPGKFTDDVSPSNSDAPASSTPQKKEPEAPFEKAKRLERALRKLYIEHEDIGEMIKLLVPLVEIYSNYQKRLQQADQEPQGKRSFERLREAVDPIPLTLATPPDRKEVNNATAIAA